MQYEKDLIFPTPIYLFDNLIDKKYIDDMKEDIIKSSNEKTRDNWQSESKLFNYPVYTKLADKIIEASKIVLDDNDFIYEEYEITDMWSNILKPNEMHRPHTHSNNILSGVYYVDGVKKDENAHIQFYDPRPQAGVIAPDVKRFTKENSTLWFFPSFTNRLIIFPSWLQHYVPANTSNKNRISIAFNIMLKGKVGSSVFYQSANF